MRSLLAFFLICLFILGTMACGSSSSPKQFCDTVCIKDTIRFMGKHALEPELGLVPQDCGVDSIWWTYEGLGAYRKSDLGFRDVKLNPKFIKCLFRDTSYAFLLFNDCRTGRGYQVQIPITKTGTYSKRSSGINNFDTRFAVAEDMVAYTDRGNIYVEDVATGKKAMMTFGQATDMDYDAIHETLDSVNITSERIYVKIKLNGKWEELDKKITLK